MTEDLVAWLLERIAEDEGLAAGTDDSASTFDGSPTTLPDSWHTRQCGYAQGELLEGCDCGVPARVLAECDAKRRIINEVIPKVDQMDDQIEGEWGTYSVGPHEESWLLLRLLALPYADRPSYREEWKP